MKRARIVLLVVGVLWLAWLGVPSAQQYYRSGAGGVTTGAGNTFSALQKFSAGIETYQDNNVANVEGVAIGQNACSGDVSDSICIGFNALAGTGGSGGLPTGATKVAIGRHAGYSSTGDQGVYLGHAAGQYAYDSGSGVIIGYQAARNAGQSASFHFFNGVAVGSEAFGATVAAQTGTAVGSNAGKNCTAAIGATIIGYKAGESATNCGGSVYVGNQAAQSFSRNNTLVIESDATLAPPAIGGLIYGEFDTRMLRFNAATVSTKGAILPLHTAATITTVGVATYTAANFLGGIILRDPNGAGRSDVTPTAALLLAAMPRAEVGQAVEFFIRNTADAAETITMTAGTGVTLSGTMTIAQNNTKEFVAVFTNVTGGAEAYTLYSIGTLVH